MTLLEVIGLLAFVAIMVWFGNRFPERSASPTPGLDEMDQLRIPPAPDGTVSGSDPPPRT